VTEDLPRTRAERRRATERRILTAAQKLFAEHGYDRTTVRAIAQDAATDPGLVIRYFGSKEALFGAVASITPDEGLGGSPDEVIEALLSSMTEKLTTESAATIAMLRSMLTRPEAADQVRDAIATQQRQLEQALPSEDRQLRAALLGAITLGTVIGRDLLRLDGLRDAAADDVTRVLGPAIGAIVHADDRPHETG
jgi:AcrR family transcriptional regulator